MKYIFHKQPLTRPSLKPHRWSSDKKAGWPASSGWRLKRARVHIRAISCFQSAKKHDRVEWCMCVCVWGGGKPFTRHYTAEERRFFHVAIRGRRQWRWVKSARNHVGVAWRGVDTKERDVIKPISASRLENNRLTRREDNGFFSSFI